MKCGFFPTPNVVVVVAVLCVAFAFYTFIRTAIRCPFTIHFRVIWNIISTKMFLLIDLCDGSFSGRHTHTFVSTQMSKSNKRKWKRIRTSGCCIRFPLSGKRAVAEKSFWKCTRKRLQDRRSLDVYLVFLLCLAAMKEKKRSIKCAFHVQLPRKNQQNSSVTILQWQMENPRRILTSWIVTVNRTRN